MTGVVKILKWNGRATNKPLVFVGGANILQHSLHSGEYPHFPVDTVASYPHCGVHSDLEIRDE